MYVREKTFYEKNRSFCILVVGFIFLMSFLIFDKVHNINAMAEVALDEEQIALAGGSFSQMFQIVLRQCGVPLSPSIYLSISAIASFLCDMGIGEEVLQNFTFGLCDFPVFRILILVWAAITVIPRLFGVSRIGGLVIEDLDKKVGYILPTLLLFPQLFSLSGSGIVANAAEGADATIGNGGSGSGFLLIVMAIVSLVFLAIQYFFVRMFFFYIDIILIPVCTLVPTASCITEAVKGVLSVLFMILSALAPGVCVVLTLILLVISIFCYKKAYISVRYFKQIYVKPFFKKLRGYDESISLVHQKMPRALIRELANKTPELVLPLYIMKKSRYFSFAWKHDRCWLVKEGPDCRIYNVDVLTRKVRRCFWPEDRKWYIKKSLRFFEIVNFTDAGEFERSFFMSKKAEHFVLSKEYYYAFEKIKEITGFADYDEEKKNYMDSRDDGKKKNLFQRITSKF